MGYSVITREGKGCFVSTLEERLKSLFIEYGSIAVASKKSGIGSSTIRKWIAEDRSSQPDVEKAFKLAEACGVSPICRWVF